MDKDKQIQKIIKYSTAELKKDSALLKRVLLDISLLKDNAPNSLRAYEHDLEEGIVSIFVDDGGLQKEQAEKVMRVIRGYVLQGFWCRAGGMTYEEAIDHASKSLDPKLKRDFEESLRGSIMIALNDLEQKGFLKKLQMYFAYVAMKNIDFNKTEEMLNSDFNEAVKILDDEYKEVDKYLKEEAERFFSK